VEGRQGQETSAFHKNGGLKTSSTF